MITTGVYILASQKICPPTCRNSSLFFGTFLTGFFKYFRFFSPLSNSSQLFNLDKNPPPPGRGWPEYISLNNYGLCKKKMEIIFFCRNLNQFFSRFSSLKPAANLSFPVSKPKKQVEFSFSKTFAWNGARHTCWIGML